MWTVLSFLLNSVYFLVALTVALYAVSMVIPSAATWARFLASVFSLVIASIYGVLASIVLALAGYRRIAQWSTGRMFVFLMYWSTGVSFRIEDPHNYLSTRPAVFIGNHQTELDVLMLGAMFPQYCVVTAKSSLKSWPFLGWYMTLSGSVFINRSNSTSAREAMSGAARDMTKERISVFMFPEGTRSYYKDPGLLPFKKGAFHLAVQAKVPVVPVVCANYSDVLSFKTMTFKSGVITIKILKPIETANLTPADVEDLTRDTRELMLRELVTLTEKERGVKISASALPKQKGDGVVKASGMEATIS